MGWPWSSPSSGDASKSGSTSGGAEPAKKIDWSLTDEQRIRMFGKPGPLQNDDKARDAQADKEMEAFLNSLADGDASANRQVLAQQEKPEGQPKHDRILPDGSLNISPMALYPRQMSCRQAFDQAFYCQSLGGKFNDIYRYGRLQSCSEQWGAFWFCMRTRTLPAKERESRIQNYYAERDARQRKERGSSEAIWSIREQPVQSAFHKDPDSELEDGVLSLKE